jgi:tetratricopeptide (TPR) repeat protein
MVRSLFMSKPAADGVIADLESDSSLTPEEREAAVELARWLGDYESGLYYDSRKIVREPDRSPEEYAEALDWARRAVDADPDSSAYRSNLGMALYRAGQHEEAVLALELADSTNGKPVERPAEAGADAVVSVKRDHARSQDLVFLAMSLWKLGRRDEARARLAQARAEYDPEERATASLVEDWLSEAEGLISPQGL